MNFSLKYVLLTVIAWVLAGLVTISYAADVDDLFKVSLPAQSQQATHKQKLFRQGLKQVLSRVTGQPTLLDGHQVLQKALTNADQYVQSFYYTRAKHQKNEEWPFMLHVTYQSQPIEQLLKQHQLPIWGQDRPLVLIWVIDRSQAWPRIINAHNKSNDLSQALTHKAKDLGLPVVLPLTDVVDASHINPEQLIQGRYSVIKKASQRYHPDAIVIVDFQNHREQVISYWQMFFDNNKFIWHRQDPDQHTMAELGIRQVTSVLSKHSAIVSNKGQPQQIILKLDGIANLQHLAKTQHILDAITGVQSVELDRLDGETGYYTLKLNSSLDDFVQKLDFNDQLCYNNKKVKEGKTVVWVDYTT